MTDPMHNSLHQQEELRARYKVLFESDEGKRVFEDLAQRFHMFRLTHAPMDTHETAFKEGQRSVVLFLRSMLIERKPITQEITTEE